MDGTTLIARTADLLEADIAGELVGLHVGSGTCYGFNASATRIWELLAEPTSVDLLVRRLVAEYDVDAATCERDARELLMGLHADGLVRLHA